MQVQRRQILFGHEICQRKFTREQVNCLQVMYFYLGDDILAIKNLLDQMFYPCYFSQCRIKEYLSLVTEAALRDFTMFSVDEFQRVYEILKNAIVEHIIFSELKELITDEFPTKRKLCQILTYNLQALLTQIATLSFRNTAQYEKYKTAIFIRRLFDRWVEVQYQHLSGSNRFDHCFDFYNEKPYVDSDEIIQAIEVMLVINSLFRIRFNRVPYSQRKIREYSTKSGRHQRHTLYGSLNNQEEFQAILDSNESLVVFSIWMDFDKNRRVKKDRYKQRFS